MTFHRQIGDVAASTGLSIRTIRYYEEVGLVPPSARTDGGFRLYTDGDVAKLLLVKRMKPLEFTLEEMRDLLETLDTLHRPESPSEREDRIERLTMYRDLTEQRCDRLRKQLQSAETFAEDLRKELNRQHRTVRRGT